MTPAIAKIAFVMLAVGWYLIRYEYARRSRRAPVVRSVRGPRETALLLISLTGLGIVPFTYIATGIPHFADYSFHPWQAWLGILVAAAGLIAFRRARTSANPMHPEAATTLVTSGVYAWTRNPMYLGWLPILAGWAAYLQHPVSLLVVPLFVLYLTRFQIVPEERALAAKFGTQFEAYRRRARRWL